MFKFIKNNKFILIAIIIVFICFVFPEVKEVVLLALKGLSLVLSLKKDKDLEIAIIEFVILILEAF